jgi:predicted enzyme related to lactoylglutathione lyase
VHLDFVVEDIHAALGRALDAGAQLDQPVRARPFGHIAVLSDPFGNGFCLLEFTGRGYDEIGT